MRYLGSIALVLSLALSCAEPPRDTRSISQLSAEELDAANIIHGEERAIFNAQADAGKAFVFTGTCDPVTPVVGLTYRTEYGGTATTFLGKGGAVLFPIDPGVLMITEVKLRTGEAAAILPASFTIANGTAITHIGGIDITHTHESAHYEVVWCESLFYRLPELFPYQGARLPIYIAPEAR